VAVLGKSLQVFIEGEVFFPAPAECPLGGNEFERDGWIVGKFRVAGEVLFDPGYVPGLQAQFQIDVYKLDQ
jgi:hypothetical protein